MSAYLLGIDVGTTGTKCVLVDVDGSVVASHTTPNELRSEHAGWAEADPVAWGDGIVSGIRALLSRSGVDPGDIAGVSSSGMVPAVVLLDTTGRPLRAAILQNDARATAEIDELRTALGHLDLVQLTGSALSQQSVAPTALWLQRHEPEAWSRATAVVGSYDWALIRLGAPVHTERNWALESGLFTISGAIAEPVLAAAHLDPALLPPTLSPGTPVGAVTRSVARETGLVEGTPLVVGGADHVLSAYAAGVGSPGDWLVKLGGAGDILVASRTPVVDPRVYLDAHPVPGLWLPNGCMATSGSLIRWYRTLIGGPELSALDDEAAAREPGAVLCLPYFLGEKSPIHDPLLRGAFVGLHLGHTRADLYRSVLEAIAFGFRHHMEVFAEIGVPLTRALITNGGSKSTLWKQIHADVLGQPMHPVIDHPGASLGAALAVGVGVKLLPDWESALKGLRLGPAVEPDQRRSSTYDERYRQWRDLGTSVAPHSHALARSNEQ
ncbi:carbohydrate kinase [Acrocarpospora pleiomorpha]|uniref:Carbohydrate kinase n=1 Tax=Acrocarpospora pleiomorpha TaxID=90975 RepID=A0A5M3XVK4_9ACTN|nr:FGGY-family carbohydrate kinase [Acrocarpospora pleiomorpha]GES24936.1 carbohydrate kinase [Acrocarpospora pleiomorpha]